MAEEIESLHKN
jgi:hypothetical protein